jgi:hypothetical protein
VIVPAARRIRYNANATPLLLMLSLLYSRDVIREMLEQPPGYREIEECRHTLRQH